MAKKGIVLYDLHEVFVVGNVVMSRATRIDLPATAQIVGVNPHRHPTLGYGYKICYVLPVRT